MKIFHVLVECLGVSLGEYERVLFGLFGSVDDLVVDVCDVQDEEDAVSLLSKISGDDVVGNVTLAVFDVEHIVYSWPADEHVDHHSLDWLEVVNVTSQLIV